MSHGICNRCGYPITEPAPDWVRCGNAHPRLSDLAAIKSLRERIEDVVARIILQARAGEHDVGVAKPSVTRATDAVMRVIGGEDAPLNLNALDSPVSSSRDTP